MCSRPVVYLKKNCPRCLKLRLFLLAALVNWLPAERRS